MTQSDINHIVLFAGGLTLSIVCSTICSLCEAALLSLTPGQIEEFARRNKTKGALWRNFKLNIHDPISAILLLNTSAHTIGATIAGAQFQLLFHNIPLTVFSVVFTWVMLQFTEILPKTLGVRYNVAVASIMTRPMQFMVWAAMPLVRVVRFLNLPFEWESRYAPMSPTDEISALAGIARLRKQLDVHQERIFRQTAALQEQYAFEVMIPETQIKFISTDMTLAEAIDVIHADPHTRFPVVEGQDVNNILGYVNFKELIAWSSVNPKAPNVRGVMRKIHFIEPQTELSDVLKLFVNQHAHMAIVTSGDVNKNGEGGETLGLITMEDILEVLFGELEDEFDAPFGGRRSFATLQKLRAKKTAKSKTSEN
ncbi:MAG: DUF21 domain-containing protein [Thermoguttaceae bacterium]|nr:DUF21 domain-containing protein [Thermoguttaceae bacterium]